MDVNIRGMSTLAKKGQSVWVLGLALMLPALWAQPVLAQSIPSTVDPGRIEPIETPLDVERAPSPIVLPDTQGAMEAPDGAEQYSFVLNTVKVEGVTAFSEGELREIYAPYLSRNITLDVVWITAQQITDKYRAEGYFLSRAYVPAQEIDGGNILIKVVEGRIGEVEIDASLEQYSHVQALIERVKQYKPVSAYQVESFMLQMKALPGNEFRAVVESMEGAEGEVRLALRRSVANPKRFVSFDNYGSRFLGPHQATFIYQDSFIPMHETSISLFSSVPTDELKYGAIRHEIPVFPDWKVAFSASHAKSAPGSSLVQNELRNASTEIGVGLYWQPIRQWRENLVFSAHLDGRNTNGDILVDNPLTRDRIRVARAKIDYDAADSWSGYNSLSLSVNRGLSVFGASEEGDANLSRADAVPDFVSIQAEISRQQAIGSSLVAVGAVEGQWASDPLFSAEEFGYGGSSMGRAYDSSEITGDHGVAASLELQYVGLDPRWDTRFVPYGFYDIGKVWNEDTAGVIESASSAGFGLRVSYHSGLSADAGIAWPLTKQTNKPLYGSSDDPRFLFRLGYSF